MKRVPTLLKLAFVLYGIGMLAAITCIVDTTALTMTVFFFIGLGSFALGFLAYAKVVWDDLRAHGVL